LRDLVNRVFVHRSEHGQFSFDSRVASLLPSASMRRRSRLAW
jgi:hypothetical protein